MVQPAKRAAVALDNEQSYREFDFVNSHDEVPHVSQSFTNLLYHLIFSTKDRRPLITLEYQPRLYDYIGGVIRGLGGISLGIDGVDDHVHVLAKLRPDKALSDVLRDLKCNGSGWMHHVFPRVADFSWQTATGHPP